MRLQCKSLLPLEEKGELENTLILFTADHGDLVGDFGGVFKSNHLNDAIHVPFLMAGGKKPDGGPS